MSTAYLLFPDALEPQLHQWYCVESENEENVRMTREKKGGKFPKSVY